ncbi:GAD-like domain-containing protein [Pedobacter frigiditerrae]|uniref:GAD-like domain-containing protein n=1 Tax=Pedobacter frigiditerrae TaxID=2530452 RepID=UPI002930E1DA|nr:GAD-like domain-containing protein [Pedobacter frigiditerrae]
MRALTFEERNKDNYLKQEDVSIAIINKYKNILPEELIHIWENMGFGIFEDGFLQLVNPNEYDFVFQYIDKLLEPSIVWAITALGDLLLWEGNENWTIAPDEGNRVKLVNVRNCSSMVLGKMDFVLNRVLGDEYGITDKSYFNAKPFLEIKNKMSKLQYSQCYGYVPALALGGSKSSKNLKIVDTKSYLNIIGMAVGKIIDLTD